MPTGYTAKLMQDGQLFDDFIMGCARAMGACITMREEPSSMTIPAKFEPSSYYADHLQKMNCYMGYAANGAGECAILIIAHTAREAKQVGYADIMDLCGDGYNYLAVRVRLIKSAPHLIAAADQEKMAQGVPQVIDNPPSCPDCGLWGPDHEPGNCDCGDR